MIIENEASKGVSFFYNNLWKNSVKFDTISYTIKEGNMNIPMHSKGSVDKNTVLSINKTKVQPAIDAQSVLGLNKATQSPNAQNVASQNSTIRSETNNASVSSVSTAQTTINAGQSMQSQANAQRQSPNNVSTGNIGANTVQPAFSSGMQTTNMQSNTSASTSISKKPIPKLEKMVQKGQKVPLATNSLALNVFFGWNVKNDSCDVDVSAFLLGENGKVLGDDWFVFYGQTESPDKSIHLSQDDSFGRQKVSINFDKLHTDVKKIVFVLTINEAFEKNLNFSMIEDAYIKITDQNNSEVVSFVMSDYYSNVISMMIGEIYLYKGAWKFSSVGNGVASDLAGLCKLYGVEVN